MRYMFISNLTGYPITYVFICHVAQLVEQRWPVPGGGELEPESFYFFPCGPISFPGLSLRTYHLGYLYSTSTLQHLDYY